MNDNNIRPLYNHSSILMGADSGLVYYTLGVNAYADSRIEDAKFYLLQSEELNPEGYGEKATLLLARIAEETPVETDSGDEDSAEDSEVSIKTDSEETDTTTTIDSTPVSTEDSGM